MANVRTSAALKQNGSSETSPTAGPPVVVEVAAGDGGVLVARTVLPVVKGRDGGHPGQRHGLFLFFLFTGGQAHPECHRGGGPGPAANTTGGCPGAPTWPMSHRIHAADPPSGDGDTDAKVPTVGADLVVGIEFRR